MSAAIASVLTGMAAADREKPVRRSQVHFHCAASSQAPTLGSHRASGPLLPGKPIALALCHYGPLPSHVLESSKLLARRNQVRRVVRGLNSLPTMPTGAFACPADNGSSVVVIAMYRRSVTRMVHVELTGCLIARRGEVVRWDLPSHGRFVQMLARLTR